jgi:[ribosomal protein S18]-alanine N-acetyltransferase
MSADNKIVAPDVGIRPAGPADFESLHEVDGRVFGELAYPYFTLRQLFDAFPECWLVAANSTGLVGYSFGGAEHRSRPCVAVRSGGRPEPPQPGLRHQTHEGDADDARHDECRDRVLTVEPANDAARRLYRRSGFRDSGYRENYFGAGEDRLVMARRLRGIPTPRPDLGPD